MKKLLATGLLLTVAMTALAQMMTPVKYTSEFRQTAAAEAELLFHFTIDAGWHVYSTELPAGGPTAATFHADAMEGAEAVGKLLFRGKEKNVYDDVFAMQVRYFEQAVTFVQKVRLTAQKYSIQCHVEYGACNDESCLPPSDAMLTASGTVELPTATGQQKDAPEKQAAPATDTAAAETAESTAAATDSTAAAMDSTAADYAAGLATESIFRPKPIANGDSAGGTDGKGTSLLAILLMGFLGGLLAVLMPCIWPIIPMTVSFFLKRSKDGSGRAVADALLYGLSIIIIYMVLGLAVTALFGSSALNAMSTNAVFNIFLFLLLVVFAMSLFGWFELELPASWATAVDAKADKLDRASAAPTAFSRVMSAMAIFLMAFALVLVSFSCTAPIIGLLLVQTATTADRMSPAVGMLGFATALALPFTVFAMFPSWMHRMPKSGTWMNTLKITLAFIELAFSLKFLSVADLAYGWHLLDREVFLALWIVIFAMLGAYLCGWLHFRSDGDDRQGARPVASIIGGMASLAFALYLVPGLWGAPCKAVSAFAPPLYTQDFKTGSYQAEARFTDYNAAMAAAQAEGKPVLIDFTGYGCVNCRKMEAAVWTEPQVAAMLNGRYVLVSLYVDDKRQLPQPMTVTDKTGRQLTLTTIGDKWSYLQSEYFNANAQPYYVILSPDGKQLTPSRGYDESVSGFMEYLQLGLDALDTQKQ